jgi:hypothetical protein
VTVVRALSVEDVSALSPAVQAATLRRACGHAFGEGALVRERGYRYFPATGGDLPHFLNRRLELSDGRTVAVTLLAGIDPASCDEVLAGCRTPSAAAAELDVAGGIWLVRLSLGASTVGWTELTGELPRRDPTAFAALAEELLSLKLCRRRTCPLCRIGG